MTVEKSTKNPSSTAEVEPTDGALAALHVWKLRQDEERHEWGDLWHDSGFIFTMEDGRPVDPAHMTKLFKKLREKTEASMRERQREELESQGLPVVEVDMVLAKEGFRLPHSTPHGLRHMGASYMWEETGDVSAVSKALRQQQPGGHIRRVRAHVLRQAAQHLRWHY